MKIFESNSLIDAFQSRDYIEPASRRPFKKSSLFGISRSAPAGDTITRRELRELCNSFAKAGLPYKAANTYAHLCKFYRWATTEELIKVNVLAGIDKPRYEMPSNATYCAGDHSGSGRI